MGITDVIPTLFKYDYSIQQSDNKEREIKIVQCTELQFSQDLSKIIHVQRLGEF